MSWCHGCRTQLLLLIAEASLGARLLLISLIGVSFCKYQPVLASQCMTCFTFSGSDPDSHRVLFHFFQICIIFLRPSIHQEGKMQEPSQKAVDVCIKVQSRIQQNLTESLTAYETLSLTFFKACLRAENTWKLLKDRKQKWRLVKEALWDYQSWSPLFYTNTVRAGTLTGTWSHCERLTVSTNCFRSVLTCKKWEREAVIRANEEPAAGNIQLMFTLQGFAETNQPNDSCCRRSLNSSSWWCIQGHFRSSQLHINADELAQWLNRLDLI